MKTKLSLRNCTCTPWEVRVRTTARQVFEVPRQAIHAVHDHRVTLAHKPDRLFELRTVRVLTRGLIREHPIQRLAFELALVVLIQRAHSDVADALPLHPVSLRPVFPGLSG